MLKRSTLLIAVFMVAAAASVQTAAAGRTPPAPSFNLYFGDLHNHTAFSDGWEGTPEDAFIHARASGADWLATSDHNFMLTQDEWTQTKEMADRQTDSNFAAAAASEYWITSGFGEVIVLNVDELRNKANFRDPEDNLSRAEIAMAFYDWLAEHPGALGVWPHPGLYGNQDNFDHWTPFRDQAMSGIEIHNYGSWLGAPANWGVHDYEWAYQMALDKGWHIMPTANSDTHNNDWISGSPVRTVLLAPSLTRANLYDALRSNRGYATLDQNLRISYKLNGSVMGSTVEPGTTYTADISITDPDGVSSDAITKVEVISDNGAVVASLTANSMSVKWAPKLRSAKARYFYVRVTTASDVSGGEGVTAWTAPVWTGR